MQESAASNSFRLKALVVAIATSMGLAACGGDDGSQGAQGSAGPEGPAGSDGSDGASAVQGQSLADLSSDGKLTRVATIPLGSELTGLEFTDEGDLFFNVQHPSDSNTEMDGDGVVYNRASVGALVNIGEASTSVTDVPVPATTAEKQTVQTSVGRYQTILQEGDTLAGSPRGGFGAILTEDNSKLVKQSNDPDFNAFIQTGAGEGYLFTNWEDRPGGVSRIKIRKDAEGLWQVVGNSAEMVDFSGVGGTWVNCFGEVTPWNTPLTSEESFATDSTSDWNNPNWRFIGGIEDLATALGNNGTFTQGPYPNPYRYGYNVELKNPTATPTPEKHFSMGRFAHENTVVMPDRKTVYQSDDGGYRVFFKFVADTAGDLSSGTLYAAKLTQNGTAPDQATFDVTWIELANSSSAALETAIAEYDNIDQSDFNSNSPSSYITDEQIGDWVEAKTGQDLPDTAFSDGSTLDGRTFDNDANDTNGNLPAGKPFGGDDRVAFLHAREAAALLGATDEWEKFEGININPKRVQEAVEGLDKVPNEDVSEAFMYMATANFDGGWSDGQGDIDVQPDDAEECGILYRAKVESGYDITKVEPVVAGGPFDANAPANTCSVDNISEPDNVAVMDDGRVLIGEDTGEHENNMLWMVQP